MSTQVGALGIRLFLEGIESPVIAAQTTAAPSQPATAAIQIIPTDSALLFLPRTLVHLFYLEELLTEQDIALANQLEEREAHQLDRFMVEDERYRLMFAGEIIGYNYQKSPNDRSFVIQCLDLSSYWDVCYQWFADWSVSGNAIYDRTHQFVGAGAGLFDNIASGTKWVISDLLRSAPENPQYRKVSGLLGGLIHLLEAVGGTRPRKADGYAGLRGVNDFFTVANLRYNFEGMIGACTEDTTSTRVYADKAFWDWLSNGMTSLGSLISFRDIMRQVGQYVFHDVYPNPIPMYVKAEPGKPAPKQVIKLVYSETTSGKVAFKKIQEAGSAIYAIKTTLGATDALLVAGQAKLAALIEDAGKVITLLQEATNLIRRGGSGDVAQVTSYLQQAISALSVFILGTTDTSKKAIEEAGTYVDRVERAAAVNRKKIESDPPKGSFLFTQLVLPEAYWAVPPKCNVIFPDQHMQFNYSRNFLREVSRLALHAGLGLIAGGGGFSQAILGRHYVAPNIVDSRGTFLKQTFEFGGRVILPHEVHSGIIPKFEWVSDGHRWGIRASKNQGKDASEKKINYLQRLANYHFFLSRWSSRTMTVLTRFNPMPVLGLPAAILDRSAPSAAALKAITETLGKDRAALPTAFLGKIVSITHNVSQTGGTSQFVLSQCRTHRSIDDEFLGVLSRERLNVEHKKITAIALQVLDALDAGNVDVEATIMLMYIQKTLKPGAVIPGVGEVQTVEVSPVVADIPISVSQALALGASQVQTEGTPVPGILQESDLVLPGAVTVTLKRFIQEGKIVIPKDLSPEQLLIPAWYSDVWHPKNITEKVYSKLLGCAAITDDQEVASDAALVDLIKRLFSETADAGEFDSSLAPNVEVALRDGFADITADGNVQSFQFGLGSIEKAIDGLTLFYGILKRRGIDIQRFIADYTRRPVATLPEVLGSSKLAFGDDGEVVPDSGIEGFHSRAFGDYNTDVQYPGGRDPKTGNPPAPIAGVRAMHALVPDNNFENYRRGAVAKDKLDLIPKHIDPRGRARQRVNAYVAELSVSRGLLGS